MKTVKNKDVAIFNEMILEPMGTQAEIYLIILKNT